MRSLRIVLMIMAVGVTARSEPRHAPRYASQADVEKLQREVAEQKALIAKLIGLQQQYLASVSALADPGVKPVVPAAEPVPPPAPPPPEPIAEPKPEPVKIAPKPAVVAKPGKGTGTILGRVKGGASGETYVYVDDLAGTAAHASAQMKQQDKQFVPRVLVVQKGTDVQFPNMDAVFHNVFSVTPDASFDLGSYAQGESKNVRLVKTGVVSVYCNMHPQMVGYILVVPGSYYARVGGDGFYKLAGVPPGHHRVVAWTPNAKPIASEIDVTDGEPATAEFELHPSRATPHTNKEGLPYGSYKD